MKMTNQYYKTTDLSAATAISLSFPIESLEKTDTQRILFVFQKTGKLDEAVESYWRGDLRVEPQQFFNQLKVIKNRLHEGI